MRLLLDTHIWIWALGQSERLTDDTKSLLKSTDQERWLSPISIWEALLLNSKRRLSLNPDPDSWLRAAFRDLPTQEAPLTHDIVRESFQIDVPHADPADRFLAATARVLDLTLVTADRRLAKTAGIEVLLNRS